MDSKASEDSGRPDIAPPYTPRDFKLEGEGADKNQSQDSGRPDIAPPYTPRDFKLDGEGADKNDPTPVASHDEKGERMLYHFKPYNMNVYEVRTAKEDAYWTGVADGAEEGIRRISREVFGFLRLITSVFVIFIIELVRFILLDVVEPIVVGVLTVVGNLLKPLLSLIFNLFYQPIVVFLWNVLTGVRQFLQPVNDILHGLLSPVAMVLRAFRLVEVTHGNPSDRQIQNV